jgi:hypothetical protein
MDSLRDEEGFDDKMRSVAATDTEVTDRLLNEGDAEWIYRSAKLRPRYGLSWTIGIVLLTTVLSGLAGMLVGYRSRDLDEVCSRHVLHYCMFLAHGRLGIRLSRIAPVLSDVPIKYHMQRFNGSLLKENVFRQDAGPEVDAAWEALGVNCALVIFFIYSSLTLHGTALLTYTQTDRSASPHTRQHAPESRTTKSR